MASRVARNFFGLIGRRGFRLKDTAIQFFKEISGLYYLTRSTLACTFLDPLRGRPNKWGPVWQQMEEVGVKSTLIVFLVAFLIGVILAFQTAYQMSRFGALEYVGALVGVAVTRELGPLMTALVMAGRVGASFTAEMGTMKVSDEVLALETMALNPVKFLITPRFLALLIMLPCLTIMADLMGILGGLTVSVSTLGIDPVIYMDNSIDAVKTKDIWTGLIKSGVFAMIIVLVGSYLAFVIEGGAERVGQNTRTSVVVSMILIIIADLVFTSIFYFFT
ncbi:MAG: MlaE family lipid ABC transporter permease subunit [Nitrospinaceae bacterium]|nr:ABC transporter permease [Nitrospinaceae bacterium]NIR56537.1 ABC transporter permease [Nitrospinaceae bacterium]NIS86994.1 ABC transporter permease [Nitrospinaceae bacterium]NIT83838.1 ABC transporter permease [Nitrospinaceae bacterium]NIU46044.1 ABC transporter permease [Nitrospinaceae bacterium]